MPNIQWVRKAGGNQSGVKPPEPSKPARVKALREMNWDDLRAYASERNIDISAADIKAAAVEIIEAAEAADNTKGADA